MCRKHQISCAGEGYSLTYRVDTEGREDMTGKTVATRRCGGYVRISQDREGAGLGVKRQQEDIEQYAARRGWQIVDWYVDNDTSATSGKPRKDWLRMLDDIAQSRIDAIGTWHIDRLTRSTRELEDVIDLHEQSGVELGTVTGEVDLATPTGRFAARMMGAAARHEHEHKVERMNRQRQQNAEMGKLSGGGMRPFGYAINQMTVVDTEATHIREAAARVLAGESLNSIVRDLAAHDVTGTTGKPFTPTVLRRILVSARISGRREARRASNGIGTIVSTSAVWPAIISIEDSDRLRLMLTKAERRTTGSTSRKHLLSGFLRCECGGVMGIGHNGRKPGQRVFSFYKCRQRGNGVTCGRIAVGQAAVEKHVVGVLLATLDSPELGERISAAFDIDPALVEKIEADERKLGALAAEYAADAITHGEWVTVRDVVKARLTANRAEFEKQTSTNAIAVLRAADDDLRAGWAALNLAQQRAVVGSLIERVTVAKATTRGRTFDVERLDIAWRI